MKLISITIYDKEYEVLFSKAFDHLIDDDVRMSITSFLNCIQNFGSETFSSDLTRVDLGSLWVDFTHTDSYIIVMLINLSSKTSEINQLAFTYNLEHLAIDILSIINENNFSFNIEEHNFMLNNYINNIISLNKKNNTLENNIINNDKIVLWQVLMAIICEPSGIPIHSKVYNSNIKSDPVILSGMLSTLNSFAMLYFNTKLRAIHLGNLKMLFTHNLNHMYVLGILCEESSKRFINKSTKAKIDCLLITMGDAIDMLFEFDANVPLITIEDIMDTYINEAQEQIKT